MGAGADVRGCVGEWVWVGGWSWVRVVGFGNMRIRTFLCTRLHVCAHVCNCVHMCVRTYMCAHGAVLGSSVDVRGWVDGWLRVAVGECGWVHMCGWVDGGGCGWLWVGVGVRGDI